MESNNDILSYLRTNYINAKNDYFRYLNSYNTLFWKNITQKFYTFYTKQNIRLMIRFNKHFIHSTKSNIIYNSSETNVKGKVSTNKKICTNKKISTNKISNSSEGKLISNSSEGKLISNSCEGKVISNSCEGKVISNSSEGKVISNSSEGKVISNSSETKVISNSSEGKVISNSSETKVISNSSETKVISNSSETKVISNSSEGKVIRTIINNISNERDSLNIKGEWCYFKKLVFMLYNRLTLHYGIRNDTQFKPLSKRGLQHEIIILLDIYKEHFDSYKTLFNKCSYKTLLIKNPEEHPLIKNIIKSFTDTSFAYSFITLINSKI